MTGGRKPRRQRADRFWTSPLWGVVGLVVSVVCAVVFFLMAIARKEPVYAVGTTELMARTEKLASHLTILWDHTPFDNICVTNIALWNSGRQFIDAADFVSPINVVASKPIAFLYAEQRRASRPELNVTLPERVTGTSSLTQTIVFGPPVSEAFEKDDGVVLRIVFSGPSDTKFSVRSRIKGVPQGFKELDLQSLQPGMRWIVGIFGAFLALAGALIVVGLPRRIRRQGFGWWLVKESLGLLGIAIFTVLLIFKLGDPLAPAWVGVRAVKQASNW